MMRLVSAVAFMLALGGVSGCAFFQMEADTYGYHRQAVDPSNVTTYAFPASGQNGAGIPASGFGGFGGFGGTYGGPGHLNIPALGRAGGK